MMTFSASRSSPNLPAGFLALSVLLAFAGHPDTALTAELRQDEPAMVFANPSKAEADLAIGINQ
jgi:hypothetical protein